MRKGFFALAAILAGTSVAIAGGSKLIRQDGPKMRLPRAAVNWANAPRVESPSLYLSPSTSLATLASQKLGPAIPALRAMAGHGATLVFHPEKGHVVRAKDMAAPPFSLEGPRASALELLRLNATAFGLPPEPEPQDDWIDEEVEGGEGSKHYGFEQRAPDGVPIYGAVVTVHTDRDGAPYLVQSDAEPDPKLYRTKAQLAPEAALTLAGRSPIPGKNPTSWRLVYYRADGQAEHRLCYQVDVGPMRSMVDAETGFVWDRVDRRCFADASGNVYDPNRGQLQATSNFGSKTLTDLDGTGFLSGTYVRVTDQKNPQAARAPVICNDPNPGDPCPNHYLYSEGQPAQVEQNNIYFYLTQTAKKMEGLSPSAGVDFNSLKRFMPLNALVDIEEDANAFFNPSDRSLQFGQGNPAKGIDNIERDLDVGAHEFGHFVESQYAPDLTPRLNSPRRAMGEAIGDFTAATVNGERQGVTGSIGAQCIGDSTIPNSANPTAFFCLRRMDNSKRTPENLRGEEHDDGEIVGGAFWSMCEYLAGVRLGGAGTTKGTITSADLDTGYQILLAGFQNLPRTNAQFADLLDALIAGQRRRFGTGTAAETAIIRGFSQDHGITSTLNPPLGSGGVVNARPKEVLLGVPADVVLGGGLIGRYFVRVPTSSATVVATLDVPAGADGAMFVAANNYNGDGTKVVTADQAGAIDEVVTITGSGATPTGGSFQTAPKIGDDAYMLIDVKNVAAASATFVLTVVHQGAAQPVDLGTFDGTVATTKIRAVLDAISDPNEVDLFYFRVEQNAINARDVLAGITVTSTSSLTPTAWIFDADLNTLAADTDGNPDDQATIQGQFIAKPGVYVVAVLPFSQQPDGPQTSGSYNFTLAPGSLAGTALSTTAPLTDNVGVKNGESKTYNVTLAAGDSRLQVFLRPLAATASPGDIDLYMTPANSTRADFEFVSIGLDSNEVVDANVFTDPPIGTSRVWFVVVFGANVSTLRSNALGSPQPYQLEVVVNQPFPSGGGGGCASSPEAGRSMTGLWLPTAIALLGLAALRRRRLV